MNNSKEYLSNEYQEKDLSYFQDERQEMLRYVPQNAYNILEVGCGCGSFSQLLKKTRPVEVWGIELDERVASIAAQKLDRVICAPFDSSLSLASQSFDCIIFNDVLEHLVDPFAALLYSKELLRDGGVVVSSIPNVRYFNNIINLLVHKDWQYEDAGILDRTHLRFFTYRSILSNFNNLGYVVECIQGINEIDNDPLFTTRYRKFRLLNWLLFRQIEDMRYKQFAVVARPCNP